MDGTLYEMLPAAGCELKMSPSCIGGPGIFLPVTSMDSNQTWFPSGARARCCPLMKMLVPPANEAHSTPSGTSDAKLVPLAT